MTIAYAGSGLGHSGSVAAVSTDDYNAPFSGAASPGPQPSTERCESAAEPSWEYEWQELGSESVNSCACNGGVSPRRRGVDLDSSPEVSKGRPRMPDWRREKLAALREEERRQALATSYFRTHKLDVRVFMEGRMYDKCLLPAFKGILF